MHTLTTWFAQGWEAICRLRCSEGLEVDKFIGAYYQRTPTDIEFPALSCEHALAIRLRHTGRLKEEGEAYLQFAMLYSTPEGARRIRSAHCSSISCVSFFACACAHARVVTCLIMCATTSAPPLTLSFLRCDASTRLSSGCSMQAASTTSTRPSRSLPC